MSSVLYDPNGRPAPVRGVGFIETRRKPEVPNPDASASTYAVGFQLPPQPDEDE